MRESNPNKEALLGPVSIFESQPCIRSTEACLTLPAHIWGIRLNWNDWRAYRLCFPVCRQRLSARQFQFLLGDLSDKTQFWACPLWCRCQGTQEVIFVSKCTVVVLFSKWNLSSKEFSRTHAKFSKTFAVWIYASAGEMRGRKKKHGDSPRN